MVRLWLIPFTLEWVPDRATFRRERISHDSSMQCVFAAFATFSTRTVCTGRQATSSRVQRQRVHLLGTVRGHAVSPGGAFELAARGLPGAGWMRIATEASGHQHRTEEIDPCVAGHDPACRPSYDGFILKPEKSEVVERSAQAHVDVVGGRVAQS